MKVLVTGGSGYVGRFLLDALALRVGYELVATYAADASFPARFGGDAVSFRRLDLANGADARALIDEVAPDIVVHLAAISSPAACEADALRCAAVNVPTALLDAIAGRAGCRLILFSTDQARAANRASALDRPHRTRPLRSLRGAGFPSLRSRMLALCASRARVMRPRNRARGALLTTTPHASARSTAPRAVNPTHGPQVYAGDRNDPSPEAAADARLYSETDAPPHFKSGTDASLEAAAAPVNAYGRSKLALEAAAHARLGARALALRCSLVIGERARAGCLKSTFLQVRARRAAALAGLGAARACAASMWAGVLRWEEGSAWCALTRSPSSAVCLAVSLPTRARPRPPLPAAAARRLL
jgi:nucleoside-diphosphate-sugar epimerase